MAFSFEEPLAIASTARSADNPSARRLQVEAHVVSLFQQFRDRLLRYLVSFGLSTHDGEEIIQEAFLALFRHLELEKPSPNLSAWLFRVVHNMALKRREQVSKSSIVLSDTPLTEDYATDPSPTAEENLIYLQTQERLRSLFRTLRQQDRRCLALRAEGLRYREIAEVLDISLGAVSISLARSLARVNRAIER